MIWTALYIERTRLASRLFEIYAIRTISHYDPYSNPAWNAVLTGGVMELLRYAESQNIDLDIRDCRSACGVCRKAMSTIEKNGIESA